MKEYWQKLSDREYTLLILSLIIGFILIFYFLVYSPIENSIANLRAQVSYQQSLAIWLSKSQTMIKSVEPAQQEINALAVQQFPLTLNQSLEKFSLKEYLQSAKNLDAQTMLVKFQSAPFDNLTRWLTYLWQNYQIKTTAIEVGTTQAPGLVSAVLILQLQHG